MKTISLKMHENCKYCQRYLRIIDTMIVHESIKIKSPKYNKEKWFASQTSKLVIHLGGF